jgi:hypothetical protein
MSMGLLAVSGSLYVDHWALPLRIAVAVVPDQKQWRVICEVAPDVRSISIIRSFSGVIMDRLMSHS